MDMSKLTQKSPEALAEAQNQAISLGHQEVSGAHLLLVLLKQDGLVSRLFQKMDVPVDALTSAVEKGLAERPKVSGPGFEAGKIYISQSLSKALVSAEQQAKRMKDE